MPRQVDHHQRRREIAYAVWAVIAEDGLDGVSLRRVAAEAGISLGRVQHYFATKDELLQYSCRTVIELAASGFAARTGDLSAAKTLRALVRQPVPVDAAARVGTLIWQVYLTRAAVDAGIREIITEALRGTQGELTRLLRGLQADGQLDPSTDAEQLARALVALGYGMTQQVLIGTLTAEQAHQSIDAALDTLLAERPTRLPGAATMAGP